MHIRKNIVDCGIIANSMADDKICNMVEPHFNQLINKAEIIYQLWYEKPNSKLCSPQTTSCQGYTSEEAKWYDS